MAQKHILLHSLLWSCKAYLLVEQYSSSAGDEDFRSHILILQQLWRQVWDDVCAMSHAIHPAEIMDALKVPSHAALG